MAPVVILARPARELLKHDHLVQCVKKNVNTKNIVDFLLSIV